MSVDHLAILGLRTGASKEDIRARYLALAKQHHPDLGGDQERFKQITEAYRVLKSGVCRYCGGTRFIVTRDGFRNHTSPCGYCR